MNFFSFVAILFVVVTCSDVLASIFPMSTAFAVRKILMIKATDLLVPQTHLIVYIYWQAVANSVNQLQTGPRLKMRWNIYKMCTCTSNNQPLSKKWFRYDLEESKCRHRGCETSHPLSKLLQLGYALLEKRAAMCLSRLFLKCWSRKRRAGRFEEVRFFNNLTILGVLGAKRG